MDAPDALALGPCSAGHHKAGNGVFGQFFSEILPISGEWNQVAVSAHGAAVPFALDSRGTSGRTHWPTVLFPFCISSPPFGKRTISQKE